MAAIKITAFDSPGVPRPHHAFLVKHSELARVKVLRLLIGGDEIEIWPADRDRIRALGEKLIKLSEEL